MPLRSDRDQTWRKRTDGTMELIEDIAVEREVPLDRVAKLREFRAAVADASNATQLRQAIVDHLDPLLANIVGEE